MKAPVVYSYFSWCITSIPISAIIVLAIYNIVINRRAGKVRAKNRSKDYFISKWGRAT